MSLFGDNFESHIIDEIEKLMRKKWYAIEKTTKYGWITAYFHSHNIVIPNSEVIKNLSRKIGEENSELALERVKEALKGVKNPLDIPGIAEEIFNQCYTDFLIRKNLKKSKTLKWKSNLAANTQAQEIYTISDKLKKK